MLKKSPKNTQDTENASQNPTQGQSAAELLADLQRTRADFENYRKQVDAQKSQAAHLAELKTVKKILPLLDDFSHALAANPDLKPLEKTFTKALKELNLTPIPSAPGTEFDPELHEAVLVEGDGATEKIAETLRPGYLYNGAVLRAAMVKVVKA